MPRTAMSTRKVQDVARHARFPVVKPDDYCHSAFERDAEAVKARAAAAAEATRLDGLVAETQARAEVVVEPVLEAAAEPPVAGTQPKRARRARADDTQDKLL